jgi:hypothetical protein
LWKAVRSEVKGKKIRIRSQREYQQSSKKYAKWHTGEVRPFFIGVMHGKKEMYARTPLINLYAFEG